MAIQVPRYDEQKIEQRRLPQVQVNPNAPIEAFGGGQPLDNVTRAAQGVLSGLNEIAANAKKDADTTRLREIETDLLKIKNKLLMDQQSGALTKKGKDALGIGETYNKAFTDYASKLEADLANDTQRKGFKELQDKVGLSLNDALERHMLQESEKYFVDTAKASIDTKADDTAINYNDPKKVSQNIKDIEFTVDSFAKRQGYSPEMRDQLMRESKSKAHQNVVQMYLANDQDEAAKVYFEGTKDQLDDKTLKSLEKTVEEGSLAGRSQRKSAEIILKHKDNMQAAMDEARSITEPKLQDATVERVKKIYSEDKSAERLRTEDLLKQAANVIEQTGSWEKVPKHIWSQFSPSERNTLKSMERDRGDSNMEAYYTLETLASNPASRQKFSDMNIIKEFGSKLNNTDLKHFIKLQGDVRQGKGETIEELDGVLNKHQTVNNVLGKAGIFQSKNKNQYVQAMDKINKNILELQSSTGKKATAEDVQNIAEKYTTQVLIPGKMWGHNEVPFYKVEPGQTVEPTSEDRQKIIDSLNKIGKKPTEENIMKVFMIKLGASRGQ